MHTGRGKDTTLLINWTLFASFQTVYLCSEWQKKLLKCSSLNGNSAAFDPYSAALASLSAVRICTPQKCEQCRLRHTPILPSQNELVPRGSLK